MVTPLEGSSLRVRARPKEEENSLPRNYFLEFLLVDSVCNMCYNPLKHREMRDVALAKLTSGFSEFPGIEAMLELHRKLNKLHNLPWIGPQISREHRLQHSIACMNLAVMSQIETLSNTLAATETWLLSFPCLYKDLVNHFATIKSTLASISPTLFSEFQPVLSDHLPEWPAMNQAMQSASWESRKECAIAHMFTLAESLSRMAGTNEKAKIDLPAELSTEDQQIIADEMTAILSPKQNWEQRLMDRVTKLKESHPVFATILYHMFFTVLIGIIVSLISMIIGQAITSTNVYVKPKTTSSVIYHLEPLQQVKIIGEQPYYFQIELTDDDTGDTLTGFVSKRSLKVADSEEETYAQN